MILRRLLHSLHGGNLRQHFVQQARIVQENERLFGMSFCKHLSEFVATPLAADLVNLGGEPLQRRKGGGLDCILKSRREAHGPEHAQLILSEARIRIANRSDDMRSKIFLPADEVEDL